VQQDQRASPPPDALLAQAERYVELGMRDLGRVPSTRIRLSATTFEVGKCGRAPASKKEGRS